MGGLATAQPTEQAEDAVHAEERQGDDEEARHGSTAHCHLDGLDERSNPALLRLGQALGVALPEVRKVPPASQLFFPGDRARFAREDGRNAVRFRRSRRSCPAGGAG